MQSLVKFRDIQRVTADLEDTSNLYKLLSIYLY